jgi:hypothetical protein
LVRGVIAFCNAAAVSLKPLSMEVSANAGVPPQIATISG